MSTKMTVTAGQEEAGHVLRRERTFERRWWRSKDQLRFPCEGTPAYWVLITSEGGQMIGAVRFLGQFFFDSRFLHFVALPLQRCQPSRCASTPCGCTLDFFAPFLARKNMRRVSVLVARRCHFVRLYCDGHNHHTTQVCLQHVPHLAQALPLCKTNVHDTNIHMMSSFDQETSLTVWH